MFIKRMGLEIAIEDPVCNRAKGREGDGTSRATASAEYL